MDSNLAEAIGFFGRKNPQHAYWINIYELCDAKRGYIYNLPTQNTTQRSVLLTGCVIKGKGHCVYSTWIDGSPVQRSSTIHGVAKQRL
jgi:hypothetical protein